MLPICLYLFMLSQGHDTACGFQYLNAPFLNVTNEPSVVASVGGGTPVSGGSPAITNSTASNGPPENIGAGHSNPEENEENINGAEHEHEHER